MKFRSLIAGVVTIAAAEAASITVDNVDITQTNAVVGGNGILYGRESGFVGIGVFSITDAEIATASSPSTIANAFTLFDRSYTFGSGFGLSGTYHFQVAAAIAINSVFGGNIYTVIGNAATLGASSEFFVFKHYTTFSTDPATSGPAFLKDGQGTVILGQFGIFTANVGQGAAPAFNTVPLIPEPSAAFLGLLGAVGLLRRRR